LDILIKKRGVPVALPLFLYIRRKEPGDLFILISGGIAFMIWGILAALLSGTLMSVQGVFNTEVTRQTSLWVSTGWVQFSAFLVCVAAWLLTGRDNVGILWQVEQKYTLLGGVIGAFITVTVILSMSALGPAQSAMLIVIAQLTVAYLIELFGWFGVERQPFLWRKVLGMAIAILGIVIFKWQK
jgi:transporter family-2 protein